MNYQYLKLTLPTDPPVEEYVPIDFESRMRLCDGAYELLELLSARFGAECVDVPYDAIIGQVAQAVELGETSGIAGDIPWALVSTIPGEPPPDPAPPADAPAEERFLHACANIRCTTTITPTP